jgi:hypothetical protein
VLLLGGIVSVVKASYALLDQPASSSRTGAEVQVLLRHS